MILCCIKLVIMNFLHRQPVIDPLYFLMPLLLLLLLLLFLLLLAMLLPLPDKTAAAITITTTSAANVAIITSFAITSLVKEVMFLVALVCLFVLSVCLWTTSLKKL